MISEFIRQFGEMDIDHFEIDGKFYQNENYPRFKKNLMHAGLFLGEVKRDRFYPSLCLIEMIAEKSKRKLFVNDKAEWLFLCGRDLMGKSIVRNSVDKGIVLVQNSKDENLGYGKIVADINKKDKIVVKNILDKGDYLRREMKR